MLFQVKAYFYSIIESLCSKVRNTATGAWKGNTATATTASARTGSGSKAKATVEAVEVGDTTEGSNLLSRLFVGQNVIGTFGRPKLLVR